MKALTLWQPWASLMALRFKLVETRGWSTKHRGETAIHSALKTPSFVISHLSEDFRKEMERCGFEYFPVQNNCCGYRHEDQPMPTGAIIATGNLVAVLEVTDDLRADLSKRELTFGNYQDGRYAWFFEDMKPLPKPIWIRGNRLLWNWEPTDALR